MGKYALFRIGALVLALTGLMHLFGYFGSKATKPVNGTEFQLQELLYGHKTNMMGAMRSQGDIFDGLNLTFAVFMFTLAALGFTIPVDRKAALVFGVSLAVMLAISLTYWFTVPTSFLAAGLLCFAGSALLKK